MCPNQRVLGVGVSIGLSQKSKMSAGTDERGGGRMPVDVVLHGVRGVVTMKCELGDGGTEPASESALCGTVSSVPRKPAPSAAFASSARSSSVACSIALKLGDMGGQEGVLLTTTVSCTDPAGYRSPLGAELFDRGKQPLVLFRAP